MSHDASSDSDKTGAGLPETPEGGDSGPAAKNSSGMFLLLILAVVVGIAAAAWFLKPPPFQPGAELEALSLTSLAEDGEGVTLDDLKGKVVLINFWGTWCPECVKEFPELVALEKKYRGRKDFRLLAVSCGAGYDKENELSGIRIQTQAFIDQRGVDMPIYLDPDFQTRSVVEKTVGWQGYPTTLLLDRNHRIQKAWVGAAGKSKFEAAIDELLNKK